jgi:penicillin-binding protein 1A
MTAKEKRIAKNIAKNGAYAISDIAFLLLKALMTVVLIIITTAAVFALFMASYVRANLTTELDVSPESFQMNLSSVIYYIDPQTGQEVELVTLQSLEFRRWVNFEDIPQHMIDATVAIEDHRFFNHQGVDWFRTTGAFLNMFLSMSDTFGGSTITQQLIKNLTHEDDVTVQRKLLEIFRALEFERNFSKEQILELYLNLIYFGHGAYGIGAAADYYFGKEVSELTVAEAASIIGITNNPSRFSPYANMTAHLERQQTILRRMNELGYFETEDDFLEALEQELVFQRGDYSVVEEVIYTWYEETIIRDVIRDLMNEFGYSEQIARRTLFTSGLRIIASIDMEMQAIVDRIYMNTEYLPVVTGSTQQVQSGIVIADPYTGEIRALSGGVGRKNRNMLLNRATMSRRPPGSAIKPVSSFAPAMEFGFLTPDTLYDDSPEPTLRGTNWMPRNADRSHSGIVTARYAFRRSLNTVPAMIIDQMGPSMAFRFMRDALGFELDAADEDYAPLALGQLTHGATVREMTSAFTMFPNNGRRVELRSYTRVYDSNGNILLDNSPVFTYAISESTAYWMTDMLVDAVVRGTGGAANIPGHQTAGKTGTSTDSRDRWFVGFTAHYIAGVWTGFDTPARMSSVGNPAAQIFRMVMEEIHEGLEPVNFARPGNVTLTPVEGVTVEDVTVRSVDIDGNELNSETTRLPVGREVTQNAPHIEGFVLIGEPQITIMVTTNPLRNVIEFVFMPEEPEEEYPEEDNGYEDPFDPYDPEYPQQPPPDDPPVDPSLPPDTNDPNQPPETPPDVPPETPPDAPPDTPPDDDE